MCVCVLVGVVQAGARARVILLICELCQGPLAGESLSGGVTYSDNMHAEEGSGLSLGLWGVGGGLRGGLSVTGTN